MGDGKTPGEKEAEEGGSVLAGEAAGAASGVS